MWGPPTGAVVPDTLEVLPWLAQHFPDQPQPSPEMTDAELTSLLAVVKGRRLQWEIEMRRLRMVELFLDRFLYKATTFVLAPAFATCRGVCTSASACWCPLLL